MKYVPSSIWTEPAPPWVQHELETIFSTVPAVSAFFRVDDVGDNAEQFPRLMELFIRYRTPLCLAVVPTWFSERQWQAYTPFEPCNELWSWHQHGYAHQNHETAGKKSEFGNSRTTKEVAADIQRGKDILENIMGDALRPMFTPPWNRCSKETLSALADHGFQILSRSADPRNPHLKPLAEVNINVDLHTRKEADPEAGRQNLFREIASAGQSGVIGFMLHHHRMNAHAFQFMEILLRTMQQIRIPVQGYEQFRQNQTLKSGN